MTEAAVCASCANEVLPGLAVCFDCELGNPTPPASPRLYRRFRWNEPARDAARFARLFGAFCPRIDADDLDWLARGRGHELMCEVTEDQDRRLTEMMTSVVPSAEALIDAPPTSPAIRFDFAGRVREKLGVTLAIGGVASFLSVPVLPIAAALTALVLVARLPRLVPKRIELEPAKAAALLGTFPEDVLIAVRAARVGLTAPAIIEAFRVCVTASADLAIEIRRGGGHVEHLDLAGVDAELGRLVRAFSRVASTTRTAGDEPYRSTLPLECLQTVGAQLRGLKATATRIPVSRRDVAPSLLSTLQSLTQKCATAQA